LDLDVEGTDRWQPELELDGMLKQVHIMSSVFFFGFFLRVFHPTFHFIIFAFFSAKGAPICPTFCGAAKEECNVGVGCIGAELTVH
jgi:hypothetical protein